MRFPPLTSNLHKGSCSRIAVVGGCQEYTGAPYFAAISSLRVGADLCHVFCDPQAAPIIKAYSPDLIVHPLKDPLIQKTALLTCHVIVVGPGLGRDPSLWNTVNILLKEALEKRIPLVIDADGIAWYMASPFFKYPAILTPNAVEIKRLLNHFQVDDIQSLSRLLGVYILSKGPTDIITDGTRVLECNESGSFRRCGGQGDLLAGMLATLLSWEFSLEQVLGACQLMRRLGKRGFEKHGRSMLASDLIQEIGPLIQTL